MKYKMSRNYKRCISFFIAALCVCLVAGSCYRHKETEKKYGGPRADYQEMENDTTNSVYDTVR